MVLIRSHPALADDGPLALLRRRRADAEHALPRSLALSSLVFLTAVVAFMVGSLLFRGPFTAVWSNGGTESGPLPPANDLQKYFVEQPFRVAPDVVPTAPARFTPVDRVQDAGEAPPIVEPAPGGVGGTSGPGESGDSRGGPGGPGGLEPGESLPGAHEFVYYEVAPEAVWEVQPEYPEIARQAGMEATIELLVLVGRDGRVVDAKIEHSSRMFDDAALTAVRQWRFRPALSSGHPVAVWIGLPVRFTLH